jgi:polyisoprenoid-binding protein YceI
MRNFRAVGLAVALVFVLPAYAQNRTVYTVDAKQSKIEIHVYREGFFKTFGHDHQITASEFSGTVQLAEPDASASSVTLVVETKSLVVIDPGEAEKDRKEVQETMLGEKVLDASRFPRIQFVSSKVRSTARKGETIELEVEGTLSLHGAAKPVSLPVRIVVGGGQLTGEGEVSLLQTDYGIAPIKVGGGAVKVKDKLKVSFHIVAKKESGSDR